MVGKQALWEGAKALLKTGVARRRRLGSAIQGAIPLLAVVRRACRSPPSSASAPASSSTVLQAAILAGIGLGAPSTSSS